MDLPRPTTGELRLIDSLKRRKNRAETGLFLAEGVRAVEEVLAAGLVPVLAVVSSSIGDNPRGQALRERLSGPALRSVADHELAKLAATETPQGVLLAVAAPRAVAESITIPERALVLVLDAVQDPGNFGTLVRSAVAFDAACVVALPGTVDPWNPKSVRAAAGMTVHVPVLTLSADAAISWLRAHGFGIFAAEVGGSPPHGLREARRMALVVGNEGAGISAPLRDAADGRVAVEMPGRAESLNVAVAAGILLHHLSELIRR